MSKLVKLTIVSASLLFGSAIMAADNQTTTNNQTEMSAPADQSVTSTTATPAAALVNINEADVKTLMTVKGLDNKTAQAIIDYRTQNGNFNAVSDLTKVKGISKSLYKKISKQLTV